MTLLAARLGDRRDSVVLDQATAFLQACTQGEPRRARPLTSPDFRWFAALLSRAQWEGPDARAFFGACRWEKLELLPQGLTALWDRAALTDMVGAPVEADDRLCVVDVLRGERSSLGLLIRAAPRAVVAAAFDPAPLGPLLAETAEVLGALLRRGA